MTITNGYTTLEALKARLFPAGTVDALDDVVLESIITSTSRLIDNFCGRRFWKNGSNEIRYYTAQWTDILEVDDLVTLAELATDPNGDRSWSRVWSATDYDLEPINAILDGKPYSRLRTRTNSSYAFETSNRGNRVTGIFGWNAVPAPVSEACLLQSMRLFLRKDAPFGVAGSTEMGQMLVIAKLDPDVELLLHPYAKMRWLAQ